MANVSQRNQQQVAMTKTLKGVGDSASGTDVGGNFGIYTVARGTDFYQNAKTASGSPTWVSDQKEEFIHKTMGPALVVAALLVAAKVGGLL